MGGGGKNKVEETKYQKELASIAKSEWERYQDVYVPLENQYMESVEKLGSDESYKNVAGDVNTAYQKQFTQAGQQQERALASAGVDPSSGKAQAARQKLGQEQAATASQATSQGQHSATESYTGGIQNIVAMGKGQQTQAINSLQDLGAAAQQKAISDAQAKATEASIPGALLGAGAGVIANSPEAQQGLKNAWSNVSGGKLDLGGTSLDAVNQKQNQLPTGTMYS